MGMSAGAPAGSPARWVETRTEGVWLGKVKDFAGHEAAAFALREWGKWLADRLEKPGASHPPEPEYADSDIHEWM